MKCKICISKGLKSKLYPGSSMSTLMACGESHYDEDGNYVNCDPNTVTTFYSCSQGHKYQLVTKGFFHGGESKETMIVLSSN